MSFARFDGRTASVRLQSQQVSSRGAFDLGQRQGRGQQDLEIESGVLRAGSTGSGILSVSRSRAEELTDEGFD